MKNIIKQLNNELLPEAFQMLEQGKTIGEIKHEMSYRVDPKLEKTFIYRLNYYVTEAFRKKFKQLNNIMIVLFSMVVVLISYENGLELINNIGSYSTTYIVLSCAMLLFFINMVYKLTLWDGRYIRSVIVLMLIFSFGDLLEMSSSYNNLQFIVKFVMQLITGGIAFYLYRKIFLKHGLFGPPKTPIKERDILDDFR